MVFSRARENRVVYRDKNEGEYLVRGGPKLDLVKLTGNAKGF